MNYLPGVICISFAFILTDGQYSNRKHLRVVTLLTPGNSLVNQNSNGTFRGFIIDLLDLIASRVGFSYTITLQPDNAYGSLQSDGSWSGVVGTLLADRADIAAIDLTVTAARDRVIDYTAPFAQSPIKVLTNIAFGLNNVRYITYGGTATVDILRGSTVPEIQAIWADIQANNGFIPPGASGDEAVARVLAGGFALVGDQVPLLPYIQANPDTLRFNGTCDDIISNTYLGLGVQQGSPLRKKLSAAISQLNQGGILQSLLTQYRLL